MKGSGSITAAGRDEAASYAVVSMRAGLACLLLVALSGSLTPATAQTTPDTVDLQVWVQALATLNVSDNWRVHLEEQPRWNDNVTQSFQVLTRTALGRRLTGRLTLWGGHAWIAKPPGPGVTHEQRAWEQASITLPNVGGWAPSLRLRQEQRWQEGWADNSHRFRGMVRMVYPLTDDGRWSFASYNEAMVTLDETPRGPARGFDQNRLFGGLLYRFTRRESLEFGTIWVHTRVRGGPDLTAHAPFVWLNLVY